MEQELVSGTIAAVVFENPENGYAVVKLDSDDGGLITVVGTIPAPAAGERLIVTGKWTAHATYGRQLEAEFLERLLPDSTAEIRAYLSSRAVRGVGPKTAEKIVAAFGTDSLKILETSPERLTEIDGISRKKALEIGASFRQQVAVRRLIEFLAGYRIPAQVAVRLYRVYGAQSLGRVQEDPYLLAQPQFGAGFGASRLRGSENNDAFRVEDGRIVTETNRAGGILGGITTGMPLTLRVGIKPTPSIGRPQKTVSLARMENTELTIRGRHDPCIAHRAVPVVEAVTACVLLDLLLEEHHGTF